MWQPTPSTSSPSSSDNKNPVVDVDDCKCSGDSGGNIEQQQQLSLDQAQQKSLSSPPPGSNSKHQQGDIPATIFGSHHDLGADKKLLESISTEEATDSGFISGHHTTSSANIVSSSDSTSEGAIGGSELKKSNIPEQHQKLQQQYDIPNLDSGCIDEVEDDEDDGHSATTQQSSSAVPTSSNEQMLLKNNVDAGMSEWFCNLSLQNNPTAASNSTSSSNASAVGLNNLDAPKARNSPKPPTSPSTASLPTSYQQHAAAGPSANTTQQYQYQQTSNSTIPPHITPANAWEHYYQQNDDGDT